MLNTMNLLLLSSKPRWRMDGGRRVVVFALALMLGLLLGGVAHTVTLANATFVAPQVIITQYPDDAGGVSFESEDVLDGFVPLCHGWITIKKVTNPSGADATFEFVPSYSGNFFLSDGETNSSGQLSTNPDPQVYSVTEITQPGWDLTSATCSDGSDPSHIELSTGETVVCTFENTQRGQIIVEKVTVPSGASDTFEFNPSYGTNFTLSDGQTHASGALAPGVYSVTEMAQTGWYLASAICSDGSTPSAIDLAAGETVTCTFENTQQLGGLEVTKVVDWNGVAPDSEQSFEICIAGPSYPGGDCQYVDYLGGTMTWMDLIPGDYTVTETDPGDQWTVDIVPETASVPADGGTVSVTVTNTHTPATLAIEKTLVAVDEDEWEPNYVTFTIAITNVGETVVDVLPLDDEYDDTYLFFAYADTMPNESYDGLVSWYDLTETFSQDLAPDASVVITVTFTVIQDISSTINLAYVEGAVDEYGTPISRVEDEAEVKDVQGPITPAMTYFTATSEEAAVQLKWATKNEENINSFYVLRATEEDAGKASKIASIASSGGSGGAEYEYRDTSALPQTQYWYWLMDVNEAGWETLHGSPTSSGLLRYFYLPLMMRFE